GTFTQISGEIDEEKPEEDMGMLLFDADNDGDNDLYIASGGFESEEGSAAMADRLYLNDGRGNLTLAENALPDNRISSSCVRGADFDADGDIDLFVGGRVIVKSYPFSPESVILRNDGNGKFSDVTTEVSDGLNKVGMVTDAVWSDYDNDNDPDLIVVGEFMPVTVFSNEKGKLTPAETSGLEPAGIWNSIFPADFDNDGDIDYIAGNLGINNFYCATPETPLQIVAKDFDSNGEVEAIMSCYLKAEDGTMQPFPIQSWQQLNKQSPIFRQRFDSYKEYGQTTIDQLLTPEEMEGALEVSTDYLHSSYIENLGNGKFNIRPLPLAAQVAPVNGINSGDFNNDGNLDVILIGNDYGNEVNMGQYDAMTGVLLLGDGKGNFSSVSVTESGFIVNGDAKALARIVSGNGGEFYLASQNRDELLAYTAKPQEGRIIEVKPEDFRAILTFENGTKRAVDITYGAGFMSQSSRKLFVPDSVSKVEIINFSGEIRQADEAQI
ncbi:MAG: VCBS repeat-containing protein, partial [Cyclobacteriaceae bacterium]